MFLRHWLLASPGSFIMNTRAPSRTDATGTFPCHWQFPATTGRPPERPQAPFHHCGLKRVLRFTGPPDTIRYLMPVAQPHPRRAADGPPRPECVGTGFRIGVDLGEGDNFFDISLCPALTLSEKNMCTGIQAKTKRQWPPQSRPAGFLYLIKAI